MEEVLETLPKERLIEEIRVRDNAIESLTGRIDQMAFRIAEYKRLLFGSKRERFIAENNPQQMALPFEVEQTPEVEAKTEKITYTRKKKANENHPGRLPLPDHLPVDEVVIEPQENTEGLKPIGKEVTDELDMTPARLFIRRYIRIKYAKADGEGVLIGELPSRPLEKAIAGPGLLSQIIIDKFADHLPVYRQIQRFKREGVILSSSTINGWQEGIFRLLDPLHEALKRQVLGEGYLQVDETPIRVLDRIKKGTTHRGYYWVYHSPIRRAVLFDYRPGRGRDGPRQMLKDFEGYLQTDGYRVYEWFNMKKGITLTSCMAHARRMFEKALDNDKARAEHAMVQFQKLYAIERRARQETLSTAKRHELRLDESLPVLNELGKWMVEEIKHVLPKSLIGTALAYNISRWDKLMAYLHDGELEIDNNLVENAIRPNALGRKNYLFAGSHHGAERAAMMYSFLGTCKANGVNPFEWLKTVLEVIPDYKANKVHELLPYNLELDS